MGDKVDAAVLTAPRRIEIREFEKPELGPKDLLMKVRYCGVCGSDLHLWDGHGNPPYPMVLGHEFIGEVTDAGGEALERRQLRAGDQIAVEMIIPCHRCEW
ncbi:MAG: alcohol dehydrogenase catalytic domain-containing protein, partial [Candidatus Bathyarchaeota archaeon]|nr:alcohol dehydrogenase catalytic domain-containing protein [Candidatus Bathyarchaeota archaeon]